MKLNVTNLTSNKYEEVEGALKYLLNNWGGIKIRKTESGGKVDDGLNIIVYDSVTDSVIDSFGIDIENPSIIVR